MAKKKATAATRKPSKRKDAWTKEEQAVFAALGVSEGDVALRNFIRGQRTINGKLYKAIDLILDALPTAKSKTSMPDPAKLSKAKKENDGVPGLLTGFADAALRVQIGVGGGGGGLWGDPETDAD